MSNNFPIKFNLQLLASSETDYEKMYNDLKEKYDNETTTFNTYKEQIEKEKETLQSDYNKLKEESEKEINDLKQANISLFLQIPKEPTKEQTPKTQEDKKTTCDDIIKIFGGN